MAILSNLERKEGFTESERMLAGFILDHVNEVVHMSITCLAEQAYSSNASIIRLCRKLGVAGYREFRIELAADLERTRSARSDVDVDRPFERGESTAAIMNGLAIVLKEAVDASIASVDSHAVDRAARVIRRARHVYLFGTGDSRISAMAFANMLLKLGIHGIIADEYGDTFASVSAAMPGDAAFFVTYGGSIVNNSAMHRSIQLLQERGCPMIWPSSAPMPFGMTCGLWFPAREMVHGSMATFYSQMCIRYLLNCLYGAVYALDYEANAAHKDSIDELKVMLDALGEA
ncbi:MurR/RpiR family transcriptional regulator [Collinsella vaginalis]|uniref:MurR/RpiR family transcriptional regulator n=1 Tax=Collinsella vaginalis TaxID=1870987 RepID=UPI0015C4FBB0|nr:MurR/RpiR family transcriptional regulator [Collinsella vaginalis]